MKRNHLRLLLIGLGILFLAPLAGIFFTFWGMDLAFHHLGQQGVSDPGHLAVDISFSLISTAGGLLIGLLAGVPLVMLSLVLHFREKSKPATLQGNAPP